MIAISHISLACTHLAIHKERTAVAFILSFFSYCLKLGKESIVESETSDVSGSIDTEAVDTHTDKLAIAIHEIVGHIRVFGVEVYAVAGDLSPPS